jgi:hypothetical protein
MIVVQFFSKNVNNFKLLGIFKILSIFTKTKNDFIQIFLQLNYHYIINIQLSVWKSAQRQ